MLSGAESTTKTGTPTATATYQPHGHRKKNLFACGSIYWIGMNADIENLIKNWSTCLDFQESQLKEKFTHHEIPGRPCKVIGPDMFK